MKRIVLLLAMLLSVALAGCGTEDMGTNNSTNNPGNNSSSNADNNTGSNSGNNSGNNMLEDAGNDMKNEFDDMVENGNVHDKDGDLTDGENSMR